MYHGVIKGRGPRFLDDEGKEYAIHLYHNINSELTSPPVGITTTRRSFEDLHSTTILLTFGPWHDVLGCGLCAGLGTMCGQPGCISTSQPLHYRSPLP